MRGFLSSWRDVKVGCSAAAAGGYDDDGTAGAVWEQVVNERWTMPEVRVGAVAM
jgi:hypothetical protein